MPDYFTPANDDSKDLLFKWRLCAPNDLDTPEHTFTVEVKCVLCGHILMAKTYLSEHELEAELDTEWGFILDEKNSETQRMARSLANRLLNKLQHDPSCSAKLVHIADQAVASV